MFLFKIQQSPGQNPGEYFSNCGAELAFLTQIFLTCFFGQYVISQSSALSTKLYLSSWPDIIAVNGNNHNKCRKFIIFLMEIFKKDSIIILGKLMPLSLATFTSVSGFKFSKFQTNK